MVGKSYLRYKESAIAGSVAMGQALQCATLSHRVVAFAASFRAVLLWALRTSEWLLQLTPSNCSELDEVSALLYSVTASRLAVGYASGHVAVFRGASCSIEGWSCDFCELGHRMGTRVLCLSMSSDGATVVSGGQDTDVTIWDGVTHEPKFRLAGHRGGVVGVVVSGRWIFSASADGLLKKWDGDVMECVSTTVVSDSQITALCVNAAMTRLYCGMRESFIKVYDIGGPDDHTVVEHGEVMRKSTKAVGSMVFSYDGLWMAAHSANSVELYQISSEEGVRRKVRRKKKRRAESASSDTAAHMGKTPVVQSGAEETVFVRIFHPVEHAIKIKAVQFLSPQSAAESSRLHFCLLLSTNTIETMEIVCNDATFGDLTPRHSLALAGHRQRLFNVAIVEDGAAAISFSSDSVKLWFMNEPPPIGAVDESDMEESGLAPMPQCVISCASTTELEGAIAGSALSQTLVCVGTEVGGIHLFNPLSGDCLWSAAHAHAGTVRSVCAANDGFSSAAADLRLVHWLLVMEDGGKVALRPTDDVVLTAPPVFVTLSPDQRLVVVGLQNYNVELLHRETNKPFLSLYGHKLPPTAAAVSTDGALVATVGMDKALRLWGADYGDCHRAIHAHDDYVNDVKFTPGTHLCWTASKDGTCKHWDGDTWALLQRFVCSPRGVTSIALASNGSHVLIGGNDKVIWLFTRTDEILFPDEEEERMMQENANAEATRRAAATRLGQLSDAVGVAGMPTAQTATTAESLMESLDLASMELQRQKFSPDAAKNPLLRHMSVWEFLWKALERVRSGEVRHVLGALTSVHTASLLEFMSAMLAEGAILNFETVSRLLLMLVTPPPGSQLAPLVPIPPGATSRKQLLASLRERIVQGLRVTADRFDMNVAVMRTLMRRVHAQQQICFFDHSMVQGAKKQFYRKKHYRAEQSTS